MPDESADGGTPNPSTEPAKGAVTTSTASTTPTITITPQAPATKAYTDEQLNAIIENRLSRERTKYADYSDLKKKAGQFDELVERSKTEQERAVDAARKEGNSSAWTVANTRLVRAEARALAAAAHFRDPADAVAFLGDLAAIKVTDEGDVDADAIKARLEDLAKTKPYLLVDEKPTRPTGDAGQGPRNGTGPVSMNELIRGLGRH